MLYLLNWRLWAAVILAAALAFTHTLAWRKGSAHTQARWDAAKAVQLQALADAEKASRAKEISLQRTKDEAVDAAAKKTQLAQAAAAASGRAAASLRDELARTRAELSSAPIAAVRARADALAQFLGQCSSQLTDLAGRADRLVIERDALIQAWPK